MLVDSRVIPRRFPAIEHGELAGVHAIVVHQTDAPTAQNDQQVTQIVSSHY